MKKLKINDYLLFDGAFGTYFSSLTGSVRPPELANLTDAGLIVQIHKEYIAAGAQAIKTNTFGICHEIAPTLQQRRQLVRSGWQNAMQAAEGTSALVFADFGPALYGENEQCAEDYIALIDEFIACGAKHFLFETFPAFDGLAQPLTYLHRQSPDAYVIVSFAAGQDGYTGSGSYYKQLLDTAEKSGLTDAIGMNCVCGPTHLFHLVSGLIIHSTFSVMPNAGYPSAIGGRTVYVDNAQYFADKLVQLRNLGVQILGGCCGTTPAHIKAAAEKLSGKQRSVPPPANTLTYVKPSAVPINVFKDRLQQGQKVIAVELDPPADTNFSLFFERAQQLKNAGVDILTFADSPLARTRTDSFMTAAKIKREIGLAVLPHLSCRDRNIIAIKAALLGAKMEAVDNVLVITGDPVHTTGQNLTKGVFSLNSYHLIQYISNLNTEVFAESPYFIGGALNINSANFPQELQRAEKKLQSGAQYLLTQSIFTETAIRNLKEAKKQLHCKILAGIMPVAGYKNAVFINNEVPGIEIPDSLIHSLEGTAPEQAAEISVAFCMEIIRQINDDCDGYYIMTPLNKTQLVCKLIEKIQEENK